MGLRERSLSCLIAVVLLLSTGSLRTALAQTAPPLGTAQSFAVLGASTVTNTGPTILTGNLGVSPGTAITGFPPGTLTGTIHSADAIAAQAQMDAHTAYNFLSTEACTTNLTGTDLGGLTLMPGVYCFNSSAQLTGTLTLNATGSLNPVFIFKIGSTFITASNSKVVVLGGSPCNVFYQVGSSATLGTGTQLSGSIFALASVTSTTGATVSGGTYALNGAVTLDTNAVVACRGTIQVCKVAGSGVIAGTNFQFNVGGSPLIVPAGPSPGGSCSAAIGVPANPVTITETIPQGTTLASVSTLPGPGLLISSNLGAGTATVSVNPGGQTVATFVDTVPPVIPTTGFLQICKVAGSGVTPGTNFTFNVAGNPITVPAGPAPGGSCSQAMQLPAGQALITETLPAGTTLTNVATLPSSGLLVSSNLGAGTATVTVNAGGQTIATFTDAVIPTTGSLQVCKIAGSGVVPGTNFLFSVAGAPVTVPAGPAPSGSCSPPLQLPPGPTMVTETLPTGTTLTSVSTLPTGALVSSNLAAGTATVTVTLGGQTVVTFLDTVIPVPPTGFIQVCKIAGSGVTVGSNFTFSVAGNPVTVPAGPAPLGTCSTAMMVPAGPTVVTETIPTGTVLTSVSTLPSGLLVSSNLTTGTATVTVNNGGQTIVTFLDTVPPVIPTTGFLQVCKVAGAGVAVGTNFNFNVAGTPVTVPAGLAPGGTCSTPIVVTAGPALVTETVPTGTELTSVTTIPSGALVSSNLAAGTATVTVTAGGQTIATFVDTIIPVIPTTGFLQICKIAGAGVAVGTNVTFNVAGTTVIVPAGPAPSGSCSPPLVQPAGTTVITETPPPGSVLTSVSTLPSGLLVSSNLAAGTATVTVTAGGQTIATFLNTIIPVIPTTGLLQVCKIAGAGITPGTNYTFNVAGTPVTVAAGPAPGGNCSAAVQLPAGPATITETLPSGIALTSVSTLPSGSLVSSNLTAGTVTVTVTAGGQTIATFLDTMIPVIPTTGFLQVCKIAGAGIAPGTNFTFNLAGTTVTVPAGPAPGGTCSTPVVAPAGPAIITETLPGGVALTSVTSLPSGSLVSTNPSAGMATVTVTAGGQTIATFLDTIIPVIPTTGLLQICKVAGAGVAAGTNVTFSVGGNPVIVPAGPAPGGSCSPALVVPVGAAVITETLIPGTMLTSVSTLPDGLLIGSNLTTGMATVMVNAGGQTIATFVDTIIPPAPVGFLQICKVAGAGVTVGTNFTFSVAGNTIMVPAGPAPGGSCSPAMQLPTGQVVVTESAPPGVTLLSIAASPSGRLVTSNLTDGAAAVTIVPGDITTASILTFTNQAAIGQLSLCKIAGAGVTAGQLFTFTVGSSTITVPAGSCSPAGSFPLGTQLTATETLPPGFQVSAISVSPAGQVVGAPNLATGSVAFTIGAGTTTVNFTNMQAAQLGQLRVCKIAGTGVPAGGNFSFTVAGASLNVAAGSCALAAATFPVGTSVMVAEIPSSGTTLTNISVIPVASQGTINLTSGTATVLIGAGITEVDFTNVAAGFGLLKVCATGIGLAPGSNLTFVMGGTTFTVPVGYCVKQGLLLVGTVVTITEAFSPATKPVGINVVPSNQQGTVDLNGQTVSATIGVGVTEVTFINTAR